MAKANRVSKKVVTGVTEKSFNEAMAVFAEADAKSVQLTAKIDAEITAIREKYADKAEGYRLTKEGTAEIIMAYCVENKARLFHERRSMETTHGTVGFRYGTPKLKVLPKWNWDKVLEKMKTVLPDFVRRTEEVDKEALIASRDDEAVSKHLNEVGIYVDKDERFYIDLKKEEQPALPA